MEIVTDAPVRASAGMVGNTLSAYLPYGGTRRSRATAAARFVEKIQHGSLQLTSFQRSVVTIGLVPTYLQVSVASL